MEKIKSLLHSGKDHPEEAQSGTVAGNATNTTTPQHSSGLTGEGSHFGGAKDSSTTGQHGNEYGSVNPTGHSATHGLGTQSSSTTAGPHSSNLSNKADPRVDSDNSRTTGSGLGGTTGAYGSETQGAGIQSGSTTAGPHSSNLANKADPRVDSDNSRLAGSTGGYTGTSGGSFHTGPSGSAVGSGPHSTETANRLDPSVNRAATGVEDATQHHNIHGGGGEQADVQHRGQTGTLTGAGTGLQQHTGHTTSSDNSHALGQSTTGYDTNTSSGGHNYGRDAAIGAGGVGAAGLAGHEYSKHQSETSRGVGNNLSGEPDMSHMPGSFPSGAGPAPTTAGPHKHDTGNELDPRVAANTQSSTRGADYGSATQLGSDSAARTGHQTSNLGEPGAPAISGIPERTRATQDPHSSAVESRADPTRDQYNDSTSKDHHYGRDAALAGGAAGVAGAAYGAGRHHENDNTTTSTAGPHDSNLANRADPRVDSDRSRDQGVSGAGAGYGTQHQTPAHGVTTTTTTHTSSSTAGPHSSNIANKADPRVDSDRSKDHHYGRDAALAGGAGAGAYGASQLHDNKTTAGPHSSDTANKADPRIDSDRSKDHHYGKEAALAGGAGAGGYGASQLHDNKTTAGPHSSDTANKADPRVDSDRSKDHHHGRDAALAGGAGAGGYGASQLHDNKTTAGPHSSDTANKADPTVDSDRSKDHHYGRDAAIAGGAGGAAAYGAHKYNERDEKDLKKAEKEAEKDQKHADKDHEKDRKHAEKEHDKHEKKSGGFLSFLHRDKNKKYSKEEEDDFDRQEREHNSHKGRDAALGVGAGGAAAGGAYAAHQHDSSHGTTDAATNKPLPTAPGNHGIGTGVGTQNALAGDSTTRHGDHTSSGDHTGPAPLAEQPLGSALGDKLHGVERNRGVAGSSGFPHEQPGEHDAHEFRKQQVATAAATQPGGHSSTTTGRHDDTTSHGSGVTGSGVTGSGVTGSGNQHGHHTGRDAAALGAGVGAGAAGAHEYEKHHDSRASNQSSHLTGNQYDSTNTQSSGIGGSHGAGGLHDSRALNQPSGLTGNQYDNTNTQSSGLGGSHGVGGVGSGQTSGLGGSDYNDPSRTTGGLTSGSRGIDEHSTTHDGSHLGGGSSGLASGQHSAVGTSGYGDSTQSEGRNRLHKDPPAGHASSKLSGGDDHVPAGGQERRGIMDRGRGELGDDTGVENSHAESSTRNY